MSLNRLPTKRKRWQHGAGSALEEAGAAVCTPDPGNAGPRAASQENVALYLPNGCAGRYRAGPAVGRLVVADGGIMPPPPFSPASRRQAWLCGRLGLQDAVDCCPNWINARPDTCR